jgi:hypothetical protein
MVGASSLWSHPLAENFDGWSDFQIVILIAKLYMAGNINLDVDGSKIKPKEALVHLTKTHNWKNVKIIQKIIPSKEDLEKAGKLCKELFGQTPLEGQDKMAKFIREGLGKWVQTLTRCSRKRKKSIRKPVFHRLHMKQKKPRNYLKPRWSA